jgi:hypothetical protein
MDRTFFLMGQCFPTGKTAGPDWLKRRMREVEECGVLRAPALQENIESTMAKTIIDKG